MSDSPKTGKLRGLKMNTASITPTVLTDVVTDCLRRSWGHVKSSAKSLARAIDTNERTASNLLEGRNAPSGATLVRLMAEDDAVFEAVLSLAGRKAPANYEQLKAIKTAVALLERGAA